MSSMNTETLAMNHLKMACRKIPSKNKEEILDRAFAWLERYENGEEKRTLETATLVVDEIGLGLTSATASLLFSLLNDGKTDLEEIRTHFPERVFKIIERILKINELYDQSIKSDTDVFQKLLLSLAEDVRVILIILGHRLYKLRQMNAEEAASEPLFLKELETVYQSFAHRLGLYNLKMEIEDRLLKFQKPLVYEEIKRKLEDTKEARLKYIEAFVTPLKEKLDKANLAYELKSRTKSIASILNKITKKEVDFEEIYDIFAIRVILDSPLEDEKMDCWKVYSIVGDIYQPNPRRLRDWVTIPKSNGYESLHTTVIGPQNRWVEVQIRSKRMDEIAEKGFAAHWRYKGGKGDDRLDKWMLSVREILESDTTDASLIDDVKLELKEKEIYIFTPKGDLRQLPAKSSVLDFAYSIHGDLGNQCAGGTVNGVSVPIRHRLKNGDQVSVYTGKKQRPNADWLEYVVTSRARSAIRQALREDQAAEAEIGKETLIRRLRNWKQEYTDAMMRRLLKHYGYKLAHDFYCALATNQIDLNEIKELLVEKKEEQPPIELKIEKPKENLKLETDVLVISDKVANVDFKLAPCCRPVFGDDVFGFVSITQGIKIHRISCPNANDMRTRYPYRVVEAQWTNQGLGMYEVVLRVLGDDDIGIANRISDLISKVLKIEIRSISLNSKEGLIDGTVSVLIPNTQFLNVLIKKMHQLKGVRKVSRVEG